MTFTPLNSCTMYDATANAWRSLPVMNKGRCSHGVVSVDDSHLYAFGGFWLTCVERLDVGAIVDGESNVQWSMCPGNMLNPSVRMVGIPLVTGISVEVVRTRTDTYVYCAGGRAGDDLRQQGRADVQCASRRVGVTAATPRCALVSECCWCAGQCRSACDCCCWWTLE